MINHNLQALHKPVQIVQDPFYDYMSWYGGPYENTLQIFDEVIDHKFWHRSDLTDWIEANMRGTVVLQRHYSGHAGWRMGFTSRKDYETFTRWWGETGFKGYFDFDLDEPTHNEMQAWLKSNLTGAYRFKRAGYGSAVGRVKTVVMIHDLTEAAAFKLVWYGTGNRVAA
jgi:hypothetical protein